MLSQFQSSLHPVVTLDMAIVDKTYSLVDVQLVVEEAFEIDPNICARLLVLHMPSRDIVTLTKNQQAMRKFLQLLDDEHPVLWLNAVNGVYHGRQAYERLVM